MPSYYEKKRENKNTPQECYAVNVHDSKLLIFVPLSLSGFPWDGNYTTQCLDNKVAPDSISIVHSLCTSSHEHDFTSSYRMEIPLPAKNKQTAVRK